jgi:hypothetical protein
MSRHPVHIQVKKSSERVSSMSQSNGSTNTQPSEAVNGIRRRLIVDVDCEVIVTLPARY